MEIDWQKKMKEEMRSSHYIILNISTSKTIGNVLIRWIPFFSARKIFFCRVKFVKSRKKV